MSENNGNNEAVNETENNEEMEDGRVVRKRFLTNMIQELLGNVNNGHPQTKEEVQGFFNLSFFENGDNSVMLAGEYNKFMLFGTLLDFMFSIHDQELMAKVERMIDEKLAQFEKEQNGVQKKDLN